MQCTFSQKLSIVNQSIYCSVVSKSRSSTTNSKTKAAVLPGINRCGNFLLFLHPTYSLAFEQTLKDLSSILTVTRQGCPEPLNLFNLSATQANEFHILRSKNPVLDSCILSYMFSYLQFYYSEGFAQINLRYVNTISSIVIFVIVFFKSIFYLCLSVVYRQKVAFLFRFFHWNLINISTRYFSI